jgi:hypothetical protein
MPKTIEENATIILDTLALVNTDDIGRSEVKGEYISKETNLSPAQINDAVTILNESDLVEWRQFLGTGPYIFREVWITSRGRYEHERIASIKKEAHSELHADITITRPPTPVGSPYGFNDEDWETVSERKSQSNKLYVVLGYQFQSNHYDSDQLQTNLKKDFETVVEKYNELPGSDNIKLIFKPLAAGYGEHLFNEISRDIISSDIAIFDTSDLNANVMVEMGVALTWGIRVLPIKKVGCIKPPSDISGQTWADYENSAKRFSDVGHPQKMLQMVRRAIRKKGR